MLHRKVVRWEARHFFLLFCKLSARYIHMKHDKMERKMRNNLRSCRYALLSRPWLCSGRASLPTGNRVLSAIVSLNFLLESVHINKNRKESASFLFFILWRISGSNR